MKVYIIRHGETDWNKDRLLQGDVDIPLNETGRKQALEVRELLKNKTIDLCVSSPLSRTYETAEIIVDNKCKIKMWTNSEEEKNIILEENKDMYLIEHAKLYNEKYLIFSDSPPIEVLQKEQGEKISILEAENADLLLDSAIKDSKISTLENDLADLTLEIAMMEVR